MDKIKLLLVDDHRLMLQGLTAMLMSHGKFEIVGTASSGEDAVNMASQLHPDVILMDIMLKKMTGIEACRWIKERHAGIKVILVSMEIKKEYLAAGIQSGIDGYVIKDVDQEVLVSAIETVYSGKQFFTEAITQLVFEDFYQQQKARPATKVKLPDELTNREYEILSLVGTGLSNKEVAERLFVSVKTVETHKSHILEKLHLRNNAELIKYAIKNKIINL